MYRINEFFQEEPPIYRPLPPNYDEQNREQSVSVRIYLELKRKILDAEYKPGALLTGGQARRGIRREPYSRPLRRPEAQRRGLVPDDRRRLRVKDITRKSIEDIYSFREIMETRSLQKIFEAIRNKDYDTAYFYLKRDHFDHSIGGRSVADLVEQRLQTLRAAEKSKKK